MTLLVPQAFSKFAMRCSAANKTTNKGPTTLNFNTSTLKSALGTSFFESDYRRNVEINKGSRREGWGEEYSAVLCPVRLWNKSLAVWITML